MEISKSSWHYKVIKFWNPRVPYNLCAYMRKLVFSLIISVIAAGAACGLAWACLYTMVWMPFMWVWGQFDPTVVIADINFLFVGLFIWALLGFGALSVVAEQRGWFARTKPRKPSLVMEYIRSKHQKVCKGIKFV